MPLDKFGPFADVFARGELAVPGHLELLGLHQPGAQIVISRIQRALDFGPAQHWIDALFDDPNWRPHLVGAMALILDRQQTLEPTALWRAVDAGSWVLPQLVVCAHIVDSDFPSQCRDRIRARAPVAPVLDLSPAERHSATGPGNARQRSAKLLASLATVGRRIPSLVSWIDEQCADPEVSTLISQDIDNAAGICDRWFVHLRSQFESRGVRLVAAAA